MTGLTLDPADYRAVIFDLDGVITRTATVHFASWKRLFDDYLAQRDGESFQPFTEQDYLDYVDGLPRYQGVETFLASRDIHLEPGSPEDPPDRETVCGLGNRKNALFNEVLARDGVEVFASSVALLHELRRRGVATAIVSSSKNCLPVLEAAAITDLFDVRVDGIIAADQGLRGKPEPDTFLAAARQLGVAADRAVVIEDALSGVMAGRRGGFKLVIGVDRVGQTRALLDNGAHIVIQDLEEITVTDTRQLPSALAAYGEIETLIRQRRPALFLDYDGTLTPIVDRPEMAVMADGMRDTVRRLAALTPVAVVSGRDLADVQALVGVDDLYFAGSHGFDITGPHGKCEGRQLGSDFLPALDEAERSLKERLTGIVGARVERKKFAIAIHYRQVADQDIPRVEEAVDTVKGEQSKLRKALGKKIFELQPAIDWHKGKAVRWLLQSLELDRPDILPVFMGDDVTDEDAFRELADDGLGILIADEPKDSAAHYVLNDPDEVAEFFAKLIQTLETLPKEA